MDERARELERRWRESGAWTDHLAVLHAQRRAGELGPDEHRLLAAIDAGLPLDRLTLLAYLCVPAAGRLLEDELVALASHRGDLGAVRLVLGDPTTRIDEAAWAQGLSAWGGDAVQAVCATTRAALEAFASAPQPPDEDETWDAERRREIRLVERALDEVERRRIRKHRRPRLSDWFDERDPLEALEECAASVLLLALGGPEERARARARWAVACPRVADTSLAGLLALAAPRLIEAALGPSGSG